MLSFGAEAEDDEEQSDKFVQKNAGKAKSTHDILDDPKLSKETVQLGSAKDSPDRIEHDEQRASDEDETVEEKTKKVRSKLTGSQKKAATSASSSTPKRKADEAADDSDSDDFTNELEKERRAKRKKEAYVLSVECFSFVSIHFSLSSHFYSEAIRDEIKALKEEYKNDRKTKDESVAVKEKPRKERDPSNDMVEAYLSEQRKYGNLQKDIPKKGDQR